jgi:probable H4MPT-linked C1 transfer pathway protein
MPAVVLGLDIGGANLKAATMDKRAASVPFPLWKQPDGLPAALAELVAKFPDADEFAVTMTGELCDCYETKRQGVNAILDAVESVAAGRRVRVWGTDGRFETVEDSRGGYLVVAAANWHALGTYAASLVNEPTALLIDIGSTTTDVVFLRAGQPWALFGNLDRDRLLEGSLIYTGVRRTPVCALVTQRVAAELFATTLDVYLTLGLVPEDPTDTDTADGRPATRVFAHGRLSRMLGGDPEIMPPEFTRSLAEQVHQRQVELIADSARLVVGSVMAYPQTYPPPSPRTAILSGSGEFLARSVLDTRIGEPPIANRVSLAVRHGPAVAACAPAYALAVLATERRP